MGSDKIHMNEQFGTESIKIQGLEEFFELLAGHSRTDRPRTIRGQSGEP